MWSAAPCPVEGAGAPVGPGTGLRWTSDKARAAIEELWEVGEGQGCKNARQKVNAALDRLKKLANEGELPKKEHFGEALAAAIKPQAGKNGKLCASLAVRANKELGLSKGAAASAGLTAPLQSAAREAAKGGDPGLACEIRALFDVRVDPGAVAGALAKNGGEMDQRVLKAMKMDSELARELVETVRQVGKKMQALKLARKARAPVSNTLRAEAEQERCQELMNKSKSSIAAFFAWTEGNPRIRRCMERIILSELPAIAKREEDPGVVMDTCDLLGKGWDVAKKTLEEAGLPADGSGEQSLELAVPVEFVCTKNGLFKVANRLCSEPCLGVDVEWRPRGKPKPSILQLAGKNEAYVIDLLAFSSRDLDEGLGKLLEDATQAKAGVGVSQDIALLISYFPDVKGLQPFSRGVVELHDLWRKTFSSGSTSSPGLSEMCKSILGAPLSKGVRMSDWEQRPLTERQLAYAALDAHCSLRLWEELSKASKSSAFQEEGEGEGVPERVQRACEAAGVAVEREGSVAGIPLKRVAKAVVLSLQGHGTERGSFVVAVVPGSERVDVAKVAAAAGLPEVGLRLATEAECAVGVGYQPGVVPPMGHKEGVMVVADEGLVGEEEVVGGAGREGWKVKGSGRRVAEAAEALVAGLTKGELEARFVVDGALKKLARWLRCLGVDAEVVEPKTKGRHVGDLLMKAEQEERVLVTNAKNVASRAGRKGFRVGANSPEEQVKELAAFFDLKGKLLSRCAQCNGEVNRPLSPSQALSKAEVPRQVASERVVWECSRCGKAFWDGFKSRRALSLCQHLSATFSCA